MKDPRSTLWRPKLLVDRRSVIAGALGLGLPTPALADMLLTGVGGPPGASGPVFTVTPLGANSQNPGGTVNITPLADSPVGSIVIAVAATNGASVNSITDSSLGGPNTWTGLNTLGSGALQAFYSVITHDLAAGRSIEFTFSDTADYLRVAALVIVGSTGTRSVDVNGTGATGTSTSPSYTSGATAQASEVVVGFCNQPTNDGHMTEASGFTSVTSTPVEYGGWLTMGYKTVAATGAQTYNPAIASSQPWQCNLVTVK